MHHFIELNLTLSIFKRQLVVHVVFAARSALKGGHSMAYLTSRFYSIQYVIIIQLYIQCYSFVL